MTESGKRIAPFGLRLPPDLRDRIQVAAKENNRSMNAEIIARLEQTFEETSTPVTQEWVKELLTEAVERATERVLDDMKRKGG